MLVVPFDDVDPKVWDALVNASPDGWPFALSSWRRVILSVEEWRLEDHSFAVTEGRNLSAVVPLHLDRRSRVLGITGWGGCGPVIAGELSGRARQPAIAAAVEEVDRIGLAENALATRFTVPPATQSSVGNVRGVNPFVFHGFDDLSGIAQVIDLSQDEGTLWHALSETARQTVRKAEKAGVVAEQADWSVMLDEYYRIHVQNYERTGATPHPKSYFAGIAREMAPAGHSILWVARASDGEPLAFHNDLHFGAGAWYHTGCSTAAALECGANYLLFWRSMLGAKAMERRWYDCGEIFPGANGSKQDGLTLFKTRFGGTPHRFLKAGKNYKPTPDDAAQSTSRVRALVRRLAAAARR